MLPDINTLLKPRPKKFRNLAKHLARDLVMFDSDEIQFTQEDIFTDLTSSRGTSRLLGVWSVRGIEFVLSKFGYLDLLKKIGLPNCKVKIDTSLPYKHRIQCEHQLQNKRVLSGELEVRRGDFPVKTVGIHSDSTVDLLIIEWFLLQHPLKNFSKRRSQLPGQDHPGLGISELIFEIFYWMSRRLKCDGVVLVPNYLHTGLFYGRRFMFINPKYQGQLKAIDKLWQSKLRLDQLAWACVEGQLIYQNTESVFHWKPAPMMMPTSRKTREYFASDEYLKSVENSKNKTDLKINSGYKKNYDSNWEAI